MLADGQHIAMYVCRLYPFQTHRHNETVNRICYVKPKEMRARMLLKGIGIDGLDKVQINMSAYITVY